MSIKSTGDSSIPGIKAILTNPADGEALTYDSATGTFVNGIQFTTVKPSVTSPSTSVTQTSAINTTFGSSAFSVTPSNYLLTHYASDWQIASDSAFTSLLTSTTLDTTNKTSWTAVIPQGYSPVYVRVRYHNGQEYSAYSDAAAYSVFQVLTITSTQNFSVPNTTNSVDVNIVGGGSGSGNPSNIDLRLKGGCAGGVTQTNAVSVTPGSTVLITVGAGATGNNTAGSSSFGNLASANGGTANVSGNGFAKGNSISNEYKGGGGGGSSGAGGNSNARVNYVGGSAGNGGAGTTFNIDSIARGGGGAGAVAPSGNNNFSYGSGSASAGGGGGAFGFNAVGSNGTNGYGGGAGGMGYNNTGTATGGNGVVVIKYAQ